MWVAWTDRFGKFLRRECPRVIRCLDRNDLFCIRAEFPDNIWIILVPENTHDKKHPAVFEIFPYRILEHICRSRIVCSVHDKQRISVDDGQSSVPVGCLKSFPALLCRGMIASLIQDT